MFAKGQSRRIWSELYKVVDSSDILVQARRSPFLRPSPPCPAPPAPPGRPAVAAALAAC